MNTNCIKKLSCPSCGSDRTVKNGSTHNHKQKHKCKDCGRQFVENPTKKTISAETKEKIDAYLLEKKPLVGIVKTTKVSKSWLQKYVNKKYAKTPRQVQVSDKFKGKRVIKCDDIWSFVENKNQKQWI